ncbi:MAG: DUF4292 domain-containing protein [Muribaculaceae bacterium]|nr:DUF4292 domain-containing protein [Muribaculaceae bacterium]
MLRDFIKYSTLRHALAAALAMMACLCVATPQANAQQLLEGRNEAEAVASITSGYIPWTTAEWTAKVKSDALPVSVTMKTFMVRDSLTLMSLRAPLVGEVARIEIDNREVLVVNKLKKRYARIPLADYGDLPARVHSDLQDILVGRVAIIGRGLLDSGNAAQADIYLLGDAGYLIAASLPEEYSGVNYGYAVDMDGRIATFMATKGKTTTSYSSDGISVSTETIPIEMTADVSYVGGSANAQVSATVKGRAFSGSLEGMAINWGGSGFSRLSIGGGYTECSFKDAIRF